MKIAVVGSRGITSYPKVENTILASPWAPDTAPSNWFMSCGVELVSGGADGVDTLAERFARSYGLSIDVIEPDYSDWSGEHPAKQRNTEIVEEADAVVAVWDGQSNGTRDTIDKALDRGVPVYVEVV